MKAKTSIIWLMPKNELEEIIKNSSFFSEAIEKLGFDRRGRSVSNLKKRLIDENIDFSHFTRNYQEMQRSMVERLRKPPIPLEQILVENSTFHRGHLKERLIKEKIFENKCHECGMEPVWQEKPLSLQLDHKNGKPNDNRKENLWLLCPNCHSQTETFAGKGHRKKRI